MGQTGLEHSNPLQCSCLENPTDRGAWQATIYGVARSWTRLKPLSRHSRYWQTLLLVLYPGDGHSAGQKLQVPAGCPCSQAEDGQRCQSTSGAPAPGRAPVHVHSCCFLRRPQPALLLGYILRQCGPRLPCSFQGWPHTPCVITKHGLAFHFFFSNCSFIVFPHLN